MTWAPLLLADPSPCLRLRVHVELLERPESDPEVRELRQLRSRDPLASSLLATQHDDGSWPSRQGPGAARSSLRPTWVALATLGYLGFDQAHSAVMAGADWLLAAQCEDGSWPISGADADDGDEGGYDWVPLQTALPLTALALCGLATHQRCEAAYDWLLGCLLDDGAWPAGSASGNPGRVAGYRRLSHSRWGCRSNTTAALACLALHPVRRSGPEARRGLDLLLGRVSRERHSLGVDVARRIGIAPSRGFFTYYARYDMAQMLDLCWRIGAAEDDDRVRRLTEAVRALRGQYGLWAHPEYPTATRWLSFDLMRSLARLDSGSDWVTLEPPTPIAPRPRESRKH